MLSYSFKQLVFPILISTLLLTGVLVNPAHAKGPSMQNDLQTWQFVTIRGNVTRRLMAYFDTQNIVVDLTNNRKNYNGRTHEGQLLVRPAIGYQLNKYISLWQGVGWTPSYQPRFRNERQLWEQILVEREFKHLKLTNRTRLEIRDIHNTNGIACRLRNQAMVSVPLGKSKKWAVVVYDEPFINLNTVGNGPRAGFDQNWLFIGVNRKFNQHFNAEFGYLNDFVNNPSGADRMNHAITASVNLNVN